MAKLVNVSAKGAKTVVKGFRDAVVKEVNELTVGDTVLTMTPKGEFAVKVGTCDETGLPVFLKFGKPVVTANDPFEVEAVTETKATPAFELTL